MLEPVIPTWFVIAAATAYGLVFGSFINVIVYRWPREQSIIRPRSHCPTCKHEIAWYDNLPLLSFLALRGRCRHCQAPISWRYPAIEALTGALVGMVAWWFGISWAGATAAAVVLLLVPLAIIDLEHKLLPDMLTYPGIALGLLAAWTGGLTTVLESVIGALAGAAVPYLVIVAYRWLRGVEGMGLGDVKLLAMIGAFLGWRGMLVTLIVGATLGAAVGLAMMAIGRGKRDTELPFGTFLATAALVAMFFGPWLERALGLVWQ